MDWPGEARTKDQIRISEKAPGVSLHSDLESAYHGLKSIVGDPGLDEIVGIDHDDRIRPRLLQRPERRKIAISPVRQQLTIPAKGGKHARQGTAGVNSLAGIALVEHRGFPREHIGGDDRKPWVRVLEGSPKSDPLQQRHEFLNGFGSHAPT